MLAWRGRISTTATSASITVAHDRIGLRRVAGRPPQPENTARPSDRELVLRRQNRDGLDSSAFVPGRRQQCERRQSRVGWRDAAVRSGGGGLSA